MATLPASTDFTGASVTEAGFKTAITQQRDFLSGLLGTDGTAATARSTLGVSTSYVSSVGATSPVVSSGGLTPTISMGAASAGANGYMSAGYASKLDGVAAGATAGPVYDAYTDGLGTMVMLYVAVGGPYGANTAVAGSSLRHCKINSGGYAIGSAPGGTWRLIANISVSLTEIACFQRVA